MTTPEGLALEGVRGLVRRARYAAAPAAVPFGDAPPAIPPLAVADSCAARPRPPMAK